MASTPPAAPRHVVTAYTAEGTSVQYDDLIKPEAQLHEIRFGRYWTTLDGLPTNDNNQEDGGKRSIRLVQSGTTNLSTGLAPHAQTPIHRTSSVD